MILNTWELFIIIIRRLWTQNKYATKAHRETLVSCVLYLWTLLDIVFQFRAAYLNLWAFFKIVHGTWDMKWYKESAQRRVAMGAALLGHCLTLLIVPNRIPSRRVWPSFLSCLIESGVWQWIMIMIDPFSLPACILDDIIKRNVSKPNLPLN